MSRRADPAPGGDRRDLVRRTTAMTDAFVVALAKKGIDASGAKAPLKREPVWRVTRRG